MRLNLSSVFATASLLTMLVTLPQHAFGVPIQWTTGDGGNNHYYDRVYVATDPNVYWNEAKTYAEASSYNGLQGYLVTITSAEENAFIANNFAGTTYLDGSWIGASDNAVEGQWEWVSGPEAGTQFWQGNYTGSPAGSNYANWESGEPNDQSGQEDYAYIYLQSGHDYFGTWNDSRANSPYGYTSYIVEYGVAAPVPEPATMLLMSTGLLGLMGARMRKKP